MFKFKYGCQTVFEKLVSFTLESLDALDVFVTFQQVGNAIAFLTQIKIWIIMNFYSNFLFKPDDFCIIM